jgi:hypothetical protein
MYVATTLLRQPKKRGASQSANPLIFIGGAEGGKVKKVAI